MAPEPKDVRDGWPGSAWEAGTGGSVARPQGAAETLTPDPAVLAEQLVALRRTMDELTQDFVSSREALERERGQMQQRLAQSQELIGDLEFQLQSAHQSRTHAEARVAELGTELRLKGRRLDEVLEELPPLRARIRALEEEQSRTQETVKSHEYDRLHEEAERQKQQVEVDRLHATLLKISQEKERLAQRLKAAEAELTDGSRAQGRLLQEVEQLTGVVREQKRSIAALRQRGEDGERGMRPFVDEIRERRTLVLDLEAYDGPDDRERVLAERIVGLEHAIADLAPIVGKNPFLDTRLEVFKLRLKLAREAQMALALERERLGARPPAARIPAPPPPAPPAPVKPAALAPPARTQARGATAPVSPTAAVPVVEPRAEPAADAPLPPPPARSQDRFENEYIQSLTQRRRVPAAGEAAPEKAGPPVYDHHLLTQRRALLDRLVGGQAVPQTEILALLSELSAHLKVRRFDLADPPAGLDEPGRLAYGLLIQAKLALGIGLHQGWDDQLARRIATAVLTRFQRDVDADSSAARERFLPFTHVLARYLDLWLHDGGGRLARDAMKTVLLSAKTGELEKRSVRALVQLLSVYPVGSWVELGDGRLARVQEAHADDMLRPVIAIPRGADGADVVVNLKANPEVTIKRAVPAPAGAATTGP